MSSYQEERKLERQRYRKFTQPHHYHYWDIDNGRINMDHFFDKFSGYHPTRYRSADDYGENIGNADSEADDNYGRGPKGWQRSDIVIKEEACEALYRDPHVDATEIDVTVKDGCIYLNGTVKSRSEKKNAERCIEYLSGVTDIQNNLKIDNNHRPLEAF